MVVIPLAGLLNIMVVGTKDGIVMVESGSKECSEEQVVDAIEFAHVEIKKICAAIEDLVSRAGKPKRVVSAEETDQAPCPAYRTAEQPAGDAAARRRIVLALR